MPVLPGRALLLQGVELRRQIDDAGVLRVQRFKTLFTLGIKARRFTLNKAAAQVTRPHGHGNDEQGSHTDTPPRQPLRRAPVLALQQVDGARRHATQIKRVFNRRTERPVFQGLQRLRG